MKKYFHPRIERILTEMYAKDGLDYYVNFAGYFDFYSDDSIPTMGLGLFHMRLVFLYNEKFMAQQNDEQLKYLMLHEIHHPLYNHQKRRGWREKELSNIVADMIINHTLDTHYGKIAKRPTVQPEDVEAIVVGMKVGQETGCRLPDKYKALVDKGEADLIFEPLYDWVLANNPPKQKCFDEHPELSDAEKEILEKLVMEASEKAKQRGNVPGHLTKALELQLKQAPGDNLKAIARACAALRGYLKTPSYRRPNRRVDGIKGYKKIGHALTVIHDWSGSMNGLHERVLSELFRDGYELQFVGGDVGVGRIFEVKNKAQLKSIPFNGGGGTCLMPMVNHVRETPKLNKNPLVVLTDGATDTLDFTGFRQKVLILTPEGFCPLSGDTSKVKQIKLKD